MLEHSGSLDFRGTRITAQNCHANPNAAWSVWKEDKFRSRYDVFQPLVSDTNAKDTLLPTRLVSSWISVDQELSLYFDAAPMLTITNINTVIPDQEHLRQASSVKEWLEACENAYGASDNKPHMSLYASFRSFVHGEFTNPNVKLFPQQLRLVLHSPQALSLNLRQLLGYFSSDQSCHRKASQSVMKSAMRGLLKEVQSLLQQWYAIAVQNRTDGYAPTCAGLVIYHLISLNTVVCFPEIERLAHREVSQGPLPSPSWLQICFIEGKKSSFTAVRP